MVLTWVFHICLPLTDLWHVGTRTAQAMIDEEVAKGHMLGPFDAPPIRKHDLLAHKLGSQSWI